eukprot:Gregarina_sp_Poly_1__3322@NODE_1956_length_3000_cov_798_001023_g1259_i0_p2_GENE_NODE_1956_length_3000_cov_798_001023_g1259_i0NODE_1956_length_3000_cov_798_001023_g1259_i0_p2_ORF_typecomplete_len220_score23_48Reticulon/PF02453_17/2e09COX15CtaA/PF02628_15/5_4e02COX15CtaA/PF02628_15/0_0085Hum_adeno_E3A/PF05393_11/0_1PRT_C/PF08372_10/5_3e02PRT_C/PF08372_10/0_25PRT_C/PF08372_10/68CD24/PF14984_6/2_2_NODE_1956_length_3000_cov_798_001023_g1259_i022642923
MSSASTSANTTPDNTRTAAGSSAMASFGASLKSQYAHAASWENVAFSASVLCGVNLIFILMWSLNLPATALVFYCLATSIVLGLPLTKFFAKPSTGDSKVEVITEKQFMDWSHQMYQSVSSFVSFVHSTFFWTDRRRSTIVVACLFAGAWICTHIRLSTLVWLGLNCALIGTPARKVYKMHVAQHVEPHLKRAASQLEKVMARVPTLTDKIVDSKTKKI